MDITHHHFRKLSYFVTIAECGSIRGAAERLGLSVPVLSQALRELECDLDLTLAVRTTRSFALTDKGKQLHIDASRLIHDMSKLMHSDSPGRRAVGQGCDHTAR